MLKVKGISARYNVITVLKDVSFSVEPGQLVAIVGANSAGKTTILKTVSGLLHQRQPAHRGSRALRSKGGR